VAGREITPKRKKAGCYLLSRVASLAIFAAIRRASSLPSSLAAERRSAHPLNLQKIVKGRFTAI
jgi:hypothetical protein